ncbi:NAD(P)/FAD-dependent oxidoreductase [Streptomyces sp. NPDC127068]|uniref:NAD(P)/FAD-dependent oxidoreductase n=1 Tax=Streptomyces sp. NPDC127068 TaxID=3347127 RepID=UPI00364DC795
MGDTRDDTGKTTGAGPTGQGAYDVVVVGGGAAGLSAALVLARARRRVAVVDAGEPRNAPAGHVHGFLTRDGTPPAELLALGRAEVAGYGAELLRGRVEHVEPGFVVRLDGGAVLLARRVLVATGLRDELPELPGVREHWGAGVLHCPYCHAHEVRDQPLGVLGTGQGAVAQALLVRQWSPDVVLFAHTLRLSEDDRERLDARGVRIVAGEVKALTSEDGRLSGVELADGRAVPRTAVFVFPRMVPRDELLTRLGCVRDEEGRVPVGPSGRTAVPGVWAVGNAVDPRALLVMAAGAGAAAAFELHHDLVAEETEAAVLAARAADGGVPPGG